MKSTPLKIPGVVLFEAKVFVDQRGFFFESFNKKEFDQAVEGEYSFVQDNHSRSSKNVLRGLHYQVKQPQGKLTRVVQGAVFDVVVDLRRKSPTFGEWLGIELSEENQRQLWVPPGLAHGFIVLSESADFLYKTTEYYAPAHERSIRWDDPALRIDWPAGCIPKLSEKDLAASYFQDAEVFDEY